MKKILKFTFVLIFILLLSGCSNRNLNKELQKAADTWNEKAPIMMNETTRFDSMTIIPPKTMQYNITMILEEKDSIDTDYLDSQIPNVVAGLKNIPENLKQDEVTIVYSYNDKNGVFTHKITITPDMLK